MNTDTAEREECRNAFEEIGRKNQNSLGKVEGIYLNDDTVAAWQGFQAGAQWQALRMQERWLPIESAPMNTPILVFSKDSGVQIGESFYGDWRVTDGMIFDSKIITHWQPLPMPPQLQPVQKVGG